MQMTQEEWLKTIERVNVAVACLIKKEGKYLLIQERQSSAYGLWNLPAGHVDKDEELEAAAVREAKEETGLDVRLISEIDIYHESSKLTVKHVYDVEIVGGDLIAPNDEIMDIQWLTFEQVKNLYEKDKLRRPWVWDVIQKDHQI